MPKLVKKNGPKRTSGSRIPDLVRLRTTFGPGATEVRRLTYFISAAVGAGGVLPAINAAYMRANSPEWASYAARWTQYRMLKICVRFVLYSAPVGSTPNTAFGLGVAATDRSGTLALPVTNAAVWAMAGAKAFLLQPTNTPSVYSAKAIDLEDQNYTSVSVSSTAFQVFLATSAAAANSALAIEFIVEFKGSQ